jgi:hypothetical protein
MPGVLLGKTSFNSLYGTHGGRSDHGAVSNHLIRSGFHAGCGVMVKILLFSEA